MTNSHNNNTTMVIRNSYNNSTTMRIPATVAGSSPCHRRASTAIIRTLSSGIIGAEDFLTIAEVTADQWEEDRSEVS